MIHMYTVNELEKMSGVTKRTISDYIAKGLLAGPSHRGRGARYSQSDADGLQVIPRLRTLMKKEFPSLREVNDFLAQLSPYELHSLARKNNEAAFEHEVRNIRVHNSLAAILPQVSPEKLTQALNELTPEQIRGVDMGRYQLGAIIDMASLLNGQARAEALTDLPGEGGSKRPDAISVEGNEQAYVNGNGHSTWSVNWLDGSAYTDVNQFAAEVTEMSPLDSITPRLENTAKDTDMDLVHHQSRDNSSVTAQLPKGAATASDRLTEIAERVERLERLLEDL